MITVAVLMAIAAVSPEKDSILNSVHEWGVVVFEENQLPAICGGPWDSSVEYDEMEAEAEAPVVWIYGEPFLGTFSVTLGDSETITSVFPAPDLFDGNSALWELVTVAGVEESIPYLGSYAWAVGYWESVPSLLLYNSYSGATVNFLYYECTAGEEFTRNLFEWNSSGNPVFTEDIEEEALLFTPYGYAPVTVTGDEFVLRDFSLTGEIDPELVPNTFSRWAGPRMTSPEIAALWDTWKPAFTEEGSYWLVFPVPEEYNNEISTISLETSDHREIQYERLFLGAIRLSH
jgi:hypothetical protein